MQWDESHGERSGPPGMLPRYAAYDEDIDKAC